MSSKTAKTVLVVGATGATGRHVVAELLQSDCKHSVKVIARSAQKMRDLLSEKNGPENHRLHIMEASLLDLSDEEIRQQTAGVDVVISCLGHNMTWKGIYGHPRELVTNAVCRLTESLLKNGKKDAKFILMGSDGVAYDGNDDVRPFMERLVIALIRYLIPPHRDNENAAAYLLSHRELEWVIIRPTDLVDDPPTSTYQLYPKPQGSLFGSGTATRSHVAKAMVDLVTSASLWEQWKFKMPVLIDDKTVETKKTK